eukprot:CAMPEP_0197873790 /NCGR_PEP_ID=MMETSP1439-20131203/3470_1 /TAXON_ID=66791 /ORGANISM="Gonyaulax spinifera, Strain CCMP409" /LENGTH=176 /DNA_ID=CAMNT_0043492855 /DNA_START=79 /DNA_END=606 /DNA_ORIENTATION=-
MLFRVVILAFLAAVASGAQAGAREEVASIEGADSNVTVPSVPDTQIAPFGKEDTAKELQSHASRTQDTLVDAIENAEVAEIKRAVFRALTRLRAAQIKEFDTIARLETQAIDEYNDNHHYRAENPLESLHSSEQPVSADKFNPSTAEPHHLPLRCPVTSGWPTNRADASDAAREAA